MARSFTSALACVAAVLLVGEVDGYSLVASHSSALGRPVEVRSTRRGNKTRADMFCRSPCAALHFFAKTIRRISHNSINAI